MHPIFKGFFLTVEGIEGVGKSTAVKYIHDYLIQRKKNILSTREPGGTKIAEEVRKILLTVEPDEMLTAETELLLMFASRCQLLAKVILPALQAGDWVVSDRFTDATYAYQGGGRQINASHIHMLEEWIVGTIKPNKTILLDAPVQVGLMRAKHRGPQDRIEQEKIDFFQRVREAYLMRAKSEPERFCIIDATQSLEVVQAELKKILDDIMEV